MRRRTFLAGAGASLATAVSARVPAPFGGKRFRAEVAALGTAAQGRLGVAIIDTGSGMRFRMRASERFPMCSTFKATLAAAVLARVDAGEERLRRAVPVTSADLVAYSPFAETRVGHDATVGELCAAAVGLSDNAAANLLLSAIGGPAALTRFLRQMRDHITRLDRTEPSLNTAIPGDSRDTTTPAAMAWTLHRLTLGDALAPASRAQLIAWMTAATTGGKRLRAGLPPGWRVADKTGTGAQGTNNVIGLLWPRRGAAPLVVTSYLTGSSLPDADKDAIHAGLARAIAREVDAIYPT
jgi:beta-lactamase class A